MFKPLLAPNNDPLRDPDYFKLLKYPLLCSPKYDGIRCIVKNGVALSRTGKPLPSRQVQKEFSHLEHYDGEIIEGNPTDADVYNRTQSHVMSENKQGDLRYYVFDYTHPGCLKWDYHARLDLLEGSFAGSFWDNVHLVRQTRVFIYEHLIDFEQKCLAEGYEGIMMRDPNASYKQGRGTFKEGIIYKLKRFQDAEAVIVGFKEAMVNENVQEKDELGYAKRSSSKEGLIAGETLGAFYVDYQEQVLEIAPGSIIHDDRKFIWDNKKMFLGELLKFRFFSHGIKDKPRFPRAVGIRHRSDT